MELPKVIEIAKVYSWYQIGRTVASEKKNEQ